VEMLIGEIGALGSSPLIDLDMLVMLGGRERNLEEYKALFTSAGFGFSRATPTSNHALPPQDKADVEVRPRRCVATRPAAEDDHGQDVGVTRGAGDHPIQGWARTGVHVSMICAVARRPNLTVGERS
jgi:hypothetical protein